jgi:hypothetical protein
MSQYIPSTTITLKKYFFVTCTKEKQSINMLQNVTTDLPGWVLCLEIKTLASDSLYSKSITSGQLHCLLL